MNVVRYSGCEVRWAQELDIRATAAGIAYPNMSLSDIQKGRHKTGENVGKRGTLIARTLLHSFKVILKGLGLFSPRAAERFRREAVANLSVRAGVLIRMPVPPVGSDNLAPVEPVRCCEER